MLLFFMALLGQQIVSLALQLRVQTGLQRNQLIQVPQMNFLVSQTTDFRAVRILSGLQQERMV